MLRIPVRIAGLLLLAIGSLLWLRARLVAPVTHPVTVAVAPSAKPAPKHPHRAGTGSTASGQQPRHTPLSSTSKSESVGDRHFYFSVDLHKSDGWYDTGIPITADVDVLMTCVTKMQELGVHCDQWVQGMLGGKVFSGVLPHGQKSNIYTVLPNIPQPPTWNPNLTPDVLLAIPEGSTETLKLKIVSKDAPEEMSGYVIRIYVRVQGSQAGEFSSSQQLEISNLAKWVPK